ncbi:MAG: hypothetical protein LBI69_02590 [Puniceicoccales bacterium]|jgi:hypothetical protein|nr:hypothetical protein [Puniceicoccales bacterium]
MSFNGIERDYSMSSQTADLILKAGDETVEEILLWLCRDVKVKAIDSLRADSARYSLIESSAVDVIFRALLGRNIKFFSRICNKSIIEIMVGIYGRKACINHGKVNGACVRMNKENIDDIKKILTALCAKDAVGNYDDKLLEVAADMYRDLGDYKFDIGQGRKAVEGL